LSYEAEIKATVANDPSLKNETQRKARETELKSDSSSSYADVKRQAKHQRVMMMQAEIELQLYRDRFTVAKLEKREAIAQLEGQNRLSIVA
jgi:hypothetical protein